MTLYDRSPFRTLTLFVLIKHPEQCRDDPEYKLIAEIPTPLFGRSAEPISKLDLLTLP